MLTRGESLEVKNKHLSHDNGILYERLTRQNDDHQRDIKRLTQENKRQDDEHQQEVERLSNANEELNARLSRAIKELKEHQPRTNATLEQRVERLKAVNRKQTALNPSPKPDTRFQFTAFACTSAIVTMSCPNNRTILTTSGVYGLFDSPDSECSGCCAPNPQYDCTEHLEEARPSDWLAIQALCDGESSCQFDNFGTASLTSCSGEPSEYMQLYYDCLPNDETGPVAFTAWANNGDETTYNDGDIIIFDEILTNAGGHYNAATSSFICPWDGVYLISANMEGFFGSNIDIDLMRNDVMLARMYVDDISSAYNRGSTTIVTECDRGDIVWVKAGSYGRLHAADRRNMFTGHILHRF